MILNGRIFGGSDDEVVSKRLQSCLVLYIFTCKF